MFTKNAPIQDIETAEMQETQNTEIPLAVRLENEILGDAWVIHDPIELYKFYTERAEALQELVKLCAQERGHALINVWEAQKASGKKVTNASVAAEVGGISGPRVRQLISAVENDS